MHYLDTSAVVAALTRELSTERISFWIEQQPPETLIVSYWVVTEVPSALALKVRSGMLRLDERNEILGSWQLMVRDTFFCIGRIGRGIRGGRQDVESASTRLARR